MIETVKTVTKSNRRKRSREHRHRLVINFRGYSLGVGVKERVLGECAILDTKEVQYCNCTKGKKGCKQETNN